MSIALEPLRLSLDHGNATLTIRYAKPPGVLELEAKTMAAIGDASSTTTRSVPLAENITVEDSDGMQQNYTKIPKMTQVTNGRNEYVIYYIIFLYYMFLFFI